MGRMAIVLQRMVEIVGDERAVGFVGGEAGLEVRRLEKVRGELSDDAKRWFA
jgi:hypothetical protein